MSGPLFRCALDLAAAIAWRRVASLFPASPLAENAAATASAEGAEGEDKASKTPLMALLSGPWLPMGQLSRLQGLAAALPSLPLADVDERVEDLPGFNDYDYDEDDDDDDEDKSAAWVSTRGRGATSDAALTALAAVRAAALETVTCFWASRLRELNSTSLRVRAACSWEAKPKARCSSPHRPSSPPLAPVSRRGPRAPLGSRGLSGC